jgi:hypothetical protein
VSTVEWNIIHVKVENSINEILRRKFEKNVCTVRRKSSYLYHLEEYQNRKKVSCKVASKEISPKITQLLSF